MFGRWKIIYHIDVNPGKSICVIMKVDSGAEGTEWGKAFCGGKGASSVKGQKKSQHWHQPWASPCMHTRHMTYMWKWERTKKNISGEWWDRKLALKRKWELGTVEWGWIHPAGQLSVRLVRACSHTCARMPLFSAVFSCASIPPSFRLPIHPSVCLPGQPDCCIFPMTLAFCCLILILIFLLKRKASILYFDHIFPSPTPSRSAPPPYPSYNRSWTGLGQPFSWVLSRTHCVSLVLLFHVNFMNSLSFLYQRSQDLWLETYLPHTLLWRWPQYNETALNYLLHHGRRGECSLSWEGCSLSWGLLLFSAVEGVLYFLGFSV